MAKKKPIKLKLGASLQLQMKFQCSVMTIWRACHYNSDTPKENEIRQYIKDNNLQKRF